MTLIRDGFQSADLDVPVVLPTLNLDFANSQSLDERITFSRGSIGTRVNKNGLIETVAANIPRFDYDPVTGECKGLLIEESRANLLTPSIPDNVSINGASIISNSITSPDGGLNASLLKEDTSKGEHYKDYGPVLTSGTTYTYSVFYKAGPGNRNFAMRIAGLTAISQIVNVTNNTITSGSIINYGNGWYRAYYSFTASATGATTVRLQLYNPYTYAGDGTSGIYVWGAQLEAGAFPTSYIPTSGSTVTRSADNASMTGTNFSSWYNQNEGTALIDYIMRVPNTIGSNHADFSILGSGFDSRIVGWSNDSKAALFVVYQNGISSFLPIGNAVLNTTNTRIKKVISLKDKDMRVCANGKLYTSDLISSVQDNLPTNFNRLVLGYEGIFAGFLNGTIAKFSYYPKALSPSQLQYLTQ